MEEAEELSDHVVIINRGRIVAEGTPQELINRYGGRKKLLLRKIEGLGKRLEELGIEHSVENMSYVIYFDDFREVVGMLEKMGDMLSIAEPSIKSPGMEEVFLNLLGARITEEGILA